jgi:hypothetical protein
MLLRRVLRFSQLSPGLRPGSLGGPAHPGPADLVSFSPYHLRPLRPFSASHRVTIRFS